MNENRVLLEIVRSFIREEKKPVFDENVDEDQLYKLARRHMLSNFLINWAKENCQNETIKAKIQSDFNQQIIKDTNENIEFYKILDEFEKAHIKTLVVKGFLMKEVYPQNYMRQMLDIDMMACAEDFKKASQIMKNLDYSEYYDHEKHLIFTKEPFMTVELHRKLIPGEDVGHAYFNQKVWEFCEPYQNYEMIYVMTKEDAYVFCMLHLLIHFRFTGIKIRDILDVYLYCEKYKDVLEQEKLNQKLQEFECEKFAENMRKIAYKWFGQNPNYDFDEVEKFILQGVSLKNQVNFEVGEKGGKNQYLLHLFFPEFKVMKGKYPILEKVPILLPFTWGARIFKDVFSKATSMNERFEKIKLIKGTSSEEVSKIQEIYQKLGIIGKED